MATADGGAIADDATTFGGATIDGVDKAKMLSKDCSNSGIESSRWIWLEIRLTELVCYYIWASEWDEILESSSLLESSY